MFRPALTTFFSGQIGRIQLGNGTSWDVRPSVSHPLGTTRGRHLRRAQVPVAARASDLFYVVQGPYPPSGCRLIFPITPILPWNDASLEATPMDRAYLSLDVEIALLAS